LLREIVQWIDIRRSKYSESYKREGQIEVLKKAIGIVSHDEKNGS